MSTQTKNFLWSYGRSFLAAVVALWLANGYTLWAVDGDIVKTLFNAGLAAILPPLLRALNENDPAFGKGFVEPAAFAAKPVAKKVAAKKPAAKKVVKKTTSK